MASPQSHARSLLREGRLTRGCPLDPEKHGRVGVTEAAPSSSEPVYPLDSRTTTLLTTHLSSFLSIVLDIKPPSPA